MSNFFSSQLSSLETNLCKNEKQQQRCSSGDLFLLLAILLCYERLMSAVGLILDKVNKNHFYLVLKIPSCIFFLSIFPNFPQCLCWRCLILSDTMTWLNKYMFWQDNRSRISGILCPELKQENAVCIHFIPLGISTQLMVDTSSVCIWPHARQE